MALTRGMTWLLLACLLTLTAVAGIRTPLLSEMGDELALAGGAVGAITSVFGLGRIVANLPAGWIADRYPPIVGVGIATTLMAAGSLSIAFAPGIVVLLIGVGAVGIASAMMNTTAMTTLTRGAAPGRRGQAMARYSTSLMTGQIIGPALAGIGAGVLSWRGTHLVASAVAVTLAVVALVYTLARRRAAEAVPGGGGATPGTALDPAGTGLPDMTRWQLAVVSSISFAVFFAMGALPQTLIPVIGAGELGLPVQVVGFALAASAVARILGATISGRIADRRSRRAALLPSLIVLAASSLLLVGPLSWGTWLAALLVFSLASSGVAIAGTLIGDLSAPERLGRRMGVYRTTGDVGLFLGPLCCGVLYELLGRGAAVVTIAGVVAVVTVLAYIALPRPRTI
jgi:MFS family permease